MIDVRIHNCKTCPISKPRWMRNPDRWQHFCSLDTCERMVRAGGPPQWCPIRTEPVEARLVLAEER